MSEQDKDDISIYWDDLVVAPTRRSTTPDELRLKAEPNDLVIGTSANRLLVVIKPNGLIQYGPEYTPDEAAEAFWEAMGQKRLEMEERLLLITHMETGAAAIHLEAVQNDSSLSEESSESAIFGAAQNLAIEVKRTTDLGKGLARRPGIPQPAEQTPRRGN